MAPLTEFSRATPLIGPRHTRIPGQAVERTHALAWPFLLAVHRHNMPRSHRNANSIDQQTVTLLHLIGRQSVTEAT